jgi:hypothetical protein
MPIPVPAMIGLLQCERRLGQARSLFIGSFGGRGVVATGGLEVLPEEGDPCFIRRDLKEESQVHLYNRPFVVGDLHDSRSSRRQTRGAWVTHQ